MAHAISTATVSFGLVSIPVKLYSAAESAARISFNMLHKKCGSRLKQQYICQRDGEKVEREDMAKGYEFAKGQYVLFSDEELKALEEKATQSVDITEFVPSDKIDPIYYDKAYYLGPEKGGERAYRLLSKAMEKSGRWALAKYAARGKMYLVLVRPVPGGLVMQQLHYADEVKQFTDVLVGEGDVKDQELALALQLMDQVSTNEFHPENYQDEVRLRVQDVIQRKVEGEQVSLAPAEEPKTQIIDLMEALKASLAKGTAKPAAEPAASGPRRLEDVDSERKPAKRADREAEAAKPRKKASR